MIELGKTQQLEIIKKTDFGVYLSENSANTEDRVLLPKNQIPADKSLGDTIEVFIYKDSEDRIIATTIIPKIQLGDFETLNVINVTNIGAFLDWGLAKDLLLPFKEQTYEVQEGDSVLVRLYIDKSHRLCASMKLYEHLSTNSPYSKGEKVTGTVYELTRDFGIFVAVDNQYSAMIPNKEAFITLKPGDVIEARITDIRPDGKLNLSIREKAYIQMDCDAELIYNKLIANNGFLPFHDKSDPDAIKEEFGLSKNSFKRAIGRLLKEGKIIIGDDGICLK